jgi:bifunctional UDP-N-acetylglucosamine pyrophosphorylase/glucosamine-1-phosphate N-acetyltransferase
MQSDVTVVILAAGLGTRMRSRRAKVLHKAGGKALVEHAVDTALAVAPPDRVFVVVGHQADEVRALLVNRGVGFIHQVEQHGTAHALLCGEQELAGLPGQLLVFYGDCPLIRAGTLRELIEDQQRCSRGGTMITTALADPYGYGRILRDAGGNVAAIVEQKAGTPEQLEVREINAGIYAFRADLFWQHVHSIRPDNPAREYYLTDMIGLLIAAGHPFGAIQSPDSGELLGINTRVELAAADRIFRDRKTTELMLAGVTIEKPETVTIDSGVRVGMDTVIESGARLLGRIGAASIIRDSQIADRVDIDAFTVIGTSRIASGSSVGPFARLRADNDVEAGAHIGNFVELKKTRMGATAKAGHLAYLGDASIGAGVNIGAGTITCNYDGVHKHGTKIGDGAFVGSNSTLVAPIEIGPGAYIAAASVITHTVPTDALAVGRARQLNKEDWAKRRRERAQK